MALRLRDAFDGLCERMNTDPAQPQYTVGIHSGVATLGNVGSLRRRSFTALGDTINLAKRVQESARGGQLLLTGATAARLPAPLAGARLEPRPALVARGRQQPTEIFEVTRDG
jgi:class 3 adenylate cyclase